MAFKNLRFGGIPVMLPILGTAREVEILSPLYIVWEGGRLWISKGFRHNGPSVPRAFRSLVPYRHNQLRASIAHDWLCAEMPRGWTLRLASEFFRAALKADGVGLITRNIMFAGVSTGIGQKWKS